MGGWHANPVLGWAGSFSGFITGFWANTRCYVTSGQTIVWSALVETVKLLGARGIVPIRLIAAVGGAIGAMVVVVIGLRVFRNRPTAALAAAAVAIFSVPGIIFGQFADVYALAIAASSFQLAVYFLWTRPRMNSRGWLIFALAAFLSQLFMYTQLWLTAGIFLAGAREMLKLRGPRAFLKGLLPAGAVYVILSALHLKAMLRIIPWSESYRWYMAAYYPLFWRSGGPPATVIKIFGYFVWRIYDFFNYQLALVFNPDIYLPLRWNWVLLPFIAVISVGLVSVFVLKRSREPGRSSRHEEISPEPAAGVPWLVTTTLFVCLVANSFFLLPFGGIRQTVFLLPLTALFYGWLVYIIILTFDRKGFSDKSRVATGSLKAILICLPLLPFLLSVPGLYRDRISRLDLDLIAEHLEHNDRPILVASEQNIHILEMALNKDSRFTEVRWPGYHYPCDALDADFVRQFPVLSFKFNGVPRTVCWVKKGYFPPGVEKALWVDMHISRMSRFEGRNMRRFYPTPEEVIPAYCSLVPLIEVSGNAPDAIHQSIYWPPNSFYLYRVIKE